MPTPTPAAIDVLTDSGLLANVLTVRTHLAEDEVESYDFGDGVTVVAQDGWDTSDLDDLTKIVYVAFDDDKAEDDSHKVSFHVRFDAAGAVDDVYALEMAHGNDIGSRGAPAKPAAENGRGKRLG